MSRARGLHPLPTNPGGNLAEEEASAGYGLSRGGGLSRSLGTRSGRRGRASGQGESQEAPLFPQAAV